MRKSALILATIFIGWSSYGVSAIILDKEPIYDCTPYQNIVIKAFKDCLEFSQKNNYQVTNCKLSVQELLCKKIDTNPSQVVSEG